MIEVARAVSPSTIEWHVGDATSLPFADDSYDAVLCQMGLMFMQDRHTAVAEMRRVTVAGGRVVVNTPGAIPPLFALMEQALVDHISADLGGFVHAVFSMHDPEDVASLLRDAGLVDVTAASVDRDAEPRRSGRVPVAVHQPHPDGPFVAQASGKRRRRRWSATWSSRGSRSSATTQCRSTCRWWSRPGARRPRSVRPVSPPSRRGAPS